MSTLKPLKLVMTAFGPYKNTEVINFNELEENMLFVISGNTGAGKTTIFDGICFALYGSASGQDRENSMMLRSDFADDDTRTSVELEFELNGRIYRILRQLGHVKEGNKSKTGERYEFYERKNDQEVPCVDRQIVSEIDKKTEALLGLTQDQFKQIVMLPQGEFRKLLTSQTENKEEILRRLFKTEPYKQISEHLRSKKNMAEDAFKREKHARDHYIGSIDATIPKREESHLFQVLSEEHYNVNQLLFGLEEEITFYEKQITTDQQKYEEAYAAHGKKQSQLHQSNVLNDRFDEWRKKEDQLKQLNGQVPLYENKEKQLGDAERASFLLPYETQAEEQRQEEKSRVQAVDKAAQTKKTADGTFERNYQIYQQEEGRKTDREEVRKQLDRLQEFLPVVKVIDEKQQQLQELENKKKRAFTELTKRQTEMKEISEKATSYSEKIKRLDQAVGQLPEKQQQLTEMRDQAKVLIDFINLRDKHAGFQKDLQLKKAAFDKETETYTKLEKSWLNNQASYLASHLHDGETCPVCGSLDHPNKAVNEEEVVTKEQLESLKQKLNEKEKHYHTAAANLDHNETQLKDKEVEIEPYHIPLDDVSSVKDQLVEKGKQLKVEVDKLHTSRKELANLKETLEKTNEAWRQVEVKKEQAEQTHQQLTTAYEKEYAVHQEKIQKIPEDMRVLSVLEQKIAETNKRKVQMEQAWEDAQAKLQQANDEQTKATANLTHASKQLEETKVKRNKTEQQFQDKLSDANFQSEQTYQQAKLSEESRQELKKEIEQFKQNRSTMSEQVNELKLALKGKERVDLTNLEQHLDQLKKTYESALNTWNQSKKVYQDASTLKSRIMDANELVREQEKQLGIIADLYDVIRGQNSQKVSFERYLQIEYLEQIIDAANHRLERLSNGQFLLIRSDRQESHGRQSGLALDVYDAYTGQTRDVKTLSGGEKFNASLSLALGMSDVIQSFQGNVSIKTMFIDEGFGTLDEESLNKAIDTLVDLQQSGRMIGVISHVQELKTIFPAVLEVHKTKEGSSGTRFLVK